MQLCLFLPPFYLIAASYTLLVVNMLLATSCTSTGSAIAYSALDNCTPPSLKYCSQLLRSLLPEIKIQRLTVLWVQRPREVSTGTNFPLLKSIPNNKARNNILLTWLSA